MNKIILYHNLQAAISDEPESAAQILYNSSYLEEWLERGGLHTVDVRAIKAKLVINKDRLHDIQFQAELFEKRRGVSFSWRTMLKRIAGALLLAFVIAVVYWFRSVRSGLSEFAKSFGVFAGILVVLFVVIVALEWLFKPTKKYDANRDEDLLTMDQEEFKKKYGDK